MHKMYANVLRNGNKSISLHVGKTLLKIKSRYMDRLKNVSRVFLAGLILCAMTLLSACSEKVEPEQRDETVNLTLRLDQVFQEKAYIRLLHDGAPDEFWYYMLTPNLKSDAAALVEEKIAQELAAEGHIQGNVGVNKNLTFKDLDPKTEYRVIAVRISPEGELLGDVAELIFKTLRDPEVFEVHPSWEIKYKERAISADNPDVETEVFTCNVYDGDSQDTYIPCLLTKEDFEEAYGGSIKACFEDYVAYLNLSHTKWSEAVTAAESEYVQDRLRHGDYILFMIGVDTEGVLTGYYTMTECRIEQEKASKEYEAWLGDWKVTGRSGATDIEYKVTIYPDENNLYYRMSGWESSSASEYFVTVPSELPILLYFEKSTGDVYVISEAMKDLADVAMADLYDFYLYGCVMADDTVIVVDIPNMRLARFSILNQYEAEVKAETMSFEYGGKQYNEMPFIFFNYSYTSFMYAGLVPMTTDAVVPHISTMRLERY